jgi:thiamine-monophosphate kinase
VSADIALSVAVWIAILDVIRMAGTGYKSGVLSEEALIAAIRDRARGSSNRWRLSGRDLRLGIGDDCAIVRAAKGEEIVVTTDFSLEGVHFRRNWHTPESVGHRCMARGLSDIAAMGARPIAAFLSLAVPREFLLAQRGKQWVARFFDGLLSLADQHKVPLAGGDTARVAHDACFDIVLLGTVKRGRALLRSGAKAGDLIYVTGALGGASAELLALERSPRRFAGLTKAVEGHPHLYPEPRLNVAKKLAAIKGVHAVIDVSDGLSTDLAHICNESGLAAELDAAAIPVHRLAVAAEHRGSVSSAMQLALNGGEDYELLFTASAGAKVPHWIAGVEVHRIGRMGPRRARGALMTLRDVEGHGSALKPGGWEHFR